MPAMRRRHARRRSASLCVGLVAVAAVAAATVVASGARGEDAAFVGAPSTARPGAGLRRGAVPRAAKGGESEKEKKPPSAPAVEEPVADQRGFLGSLWEQWGILGLLVGLVVAFGGTSLLGGDIDISETFFAAMDTLPISQAVNEGVDASADLEGAMGAMGAAGVAAGVQQSADAVQDGLATAAESAAATMAGVNAIAGEAAQEVGEAVKGAEVVAEVEAAELFEEELAAEVLGTTAVEIAGRVGLAGAFGATTAFSGLVAEGIKGRKPKEGSAIFLDISETTPGTVRQSGRQANLAPVEGDRPASAWELGMQNFMREWESLLQAAKKGNTVERRQIPKFVPLLKLSNQAVIDREKEREASGGEVPAPVPVRIAYDVLCLFIDVVFEDRPIQRFWFLETVARMPYFAYISVLHLYETLGWWRSPELRGVHAAEEDNELHHLLIMESLGGDQRWLDRFFAQHGAIFYYWILISFYVIDPRWSYNFSRLIEAHAVDTYGEFRDANEERLKSLPPPPVAIEYYRSPDMGMFDRFQTALVAEGKTRRPPCSTLYDVFANICDDEEQHVLTMQACEEWVEGGEAAVPLGFNRLSVQDYEKEVTRTEEGRAAWVAWGEEVAAAAREAGRQTK